jgi:uncharacterized protein with FMN-binding domain
VEKQNKPSLWKQLSPLLHLWPAALTLALVMVTLPLTRPVLAALPERLTVTAAAVEEPEEQPEQEEELNALLDANYEDGVYTGSAQGYGGLIQVRVSVEHGQITCVEILSADGETSSFFNRALGVVDSVLKYQTWEVDTVSGATYSSRGILAAIQNALTGEKVKTETPKQEEPVAALEEDTYEAPQNGYRDGTYTGTATGFGGDITVEVVIEQGNIVSIRVLSAAGETQSFWNKAVAVIDRALAAGSPNVDTVSGATYSSTGILNALKRALAQAAIGEVEDLTVVELPPEDEEEEDVILPETPQEPVPEQPTDPSQPGEDGAEEPDPGETELGPYTDGVYTASTLCTDEEVFSYQLFVTITVMNGNITQVDVEKGEDTSDDPDSNDTFLAYAMAGRTRKNVWYEGVIRQILQKQSAQEIDVVSGATYSSRAIAEAARQALEGIERETEE